MMSEVAHFVKDVISPAGAVSIRAGKHPASASIESHTRDGTLRTHRAGDPDCDIDFADEPGHQAHCDAEQAFVLRAIARNLDPSRPMADAIASLAICLAADESIRLSRPNLPPDLNMTALSLENMSNSFGFTEVLKDLTLSVEGKRCPDHTLSASFQGSRSSIRLRSWPLDDGRAGAGQRGMGLNRPQPPPVEPGKQRLEPGKVHRKRSRRTTGSSA